MSIKGVPAIPYTREALVASFSPSKGPRNGFDQTLIKHRTQRLALILTKSREVEYWHDFRTVIQELVRPADAKRPITHVVLIGESALKVPFLETVKWLSRNGLSECLPVQAEMTASVE